MNENIKPVGVLTIVLTDENGKVKDERIFKNKVTNVGAAYIAARVGPTATTAMGYMGIGTGTNTQAVTDTTLGTPIGTRSTLTTSQSGAVLTYSATFGPSVSTAGAITEAGIFDAATGGNMMTRTTFSPINKGSSDTISITWTVTITVV